MSSQLRQFENRKQDHIRLALESRNEALGQSGLDHIILRHEALPDLNFEDIQINIDRLGELAASPFIISSMTAGHSDAININETLAIAAEQQGWAMGVGSQRRQLFDASAAQEWQTIREKAPNVVLFGNIGIAQLIQTPVSAIEELVHSLQAKAMIVHTNPLQESIQVEGTPQFKGSFEALATLCEKLSVPVILKETGCGFSFETLERLTEINIAAVDLSGFGGTHWGRIEGHRAEENSIPMQAAETFKNWGISTLESLLAAYELQPHYEIWASGGIRSGLDAAKCIALGATTIGFAKPMLEAAMAGGVEAVIARMQTLEYELKVALFCTSCQNPYELQEKDLWQIQAP